MNNGARSSFIVHRWFLHGLITLVVTLPLERLHSWLPLGICKDQLDFLLYLFEFLVAETGQADAFLEELQRLVERQLFTLQTLDDLFQLLERLLELVALRSYHSATQSLTPWSLRQPCIRGGPS
jgi:hypothetical protein